jgi:threonine dehydrogenase-like Zn-dependent dehydrogenase
MQHEVRAFWVAAPGRGEIRTDRLAPLRPDEVLVRTLYSGVSRGTEALVFTGRVPPGEWQRMRAPFQEGDFPAPVKYGYCNVGIVEQGPPALVGRTVFALYPHQTRYIVPADAVHVVPDDVPAGRAVLAANLETAINVLWDARPLVGDRVEVIGGGTVGSLTAYLAARVAGCEVELVDINPGRAAIAGRLGVAFATPDHARPENDLVIHASGAAAGLQLALALAAAEARIVELSWYGDATVALPLGGAFHARRLTIAASQVGSIPPRQQPRWSTRRRMALALRLLSDDVLDALISGESAFDQLPAVMAALAEGPGDTLCHRVRY